MLHHLLSSLTATLLLINNEAAIVSGNRATLRSRRSLQESSQAECLASLALLETNLGVAIINAQQEINDHWIVMSDDPNFVQLNNEKPYSPLPCDSVNAMKCDSATLTLTHKGKTLVHENFTPTCRPKACANDVEYSSSLVERANVNGPSSLFWYTRGDVVSTACAANSECTMTFNYCGVEAIVPFEYSKLLSKEEHLTILRTDSGGGPGADNTRPTEEKPVRDHGQVQERSDNSVSREESDISEVEDID